MNKSLQQIGNSAKLLGAICGGLLISLPAMAQQPVANPNAKVNPCPSIFYQEPHNSRVFVPQGCAPNAFTRQNAQGVSSQSNVPANPTADRVRLGVGGEAPNATSSQPSNSNNSQTDNYSNNSQQSSSEKNYQENGPAGGYTGRQRLSSPDQNYRSNTQQSTSDRNYSNNSQQSSSDTNYQQNGPAGGYTGRQRLSSPDQNYRNNSQQSTSDRNNTNNSQQSSSDTNYQQNGPAGGYTGRQRLSSPDQNYRNNSQQSTSDRNYSNNSQQSSSDTNYQQNGPAGGYTNRNLSSPDQNYRNNQQTQSSVLPQQQAVAMVMPTNGKVSIKLVNQTNAPMTYQAIGDTAPRTLQGKSEVMLQGLRTPANITFYRQDAGFVMVTPQGDSQQGMLQLTMRETTDAAMGRNAIRVESNGAVYLN